MLWNRINWSSGRNKTQGNERAAGMGTGGSTGGSTALGWEGKTQVGSHTFSAFSAYRRPPDLVHAAIGQGRESKGKQGRSRRANHDTVQYSVCNGGLMRQQQEGWRLAAVE